MSGFGRFNPETWATVGRLRPFVEPHRRHARAVAWATLASLPPAWILPILVNDLFSKSAESHFAGDRWWWLVACVVAGAAASWWRGAAVARLRVRVLHRLRAALMRALRSTSLDAAVGSASGAEARVTDDLLLASGALPDRWWEFVGAAAQAIVAACILVVIAPTFAGLSVVGVVVIAAYGWATYRPLHAASLRVRESDEQARREIAESIRGESALRSANAEIVDTTRVVRAAADTARKSLHRDLLGLSLGNPLVVMTGLLPLVLLNAGAVDIASEKMGPGVLIAAFILLGQTVDGTARCVSMHAGLGDALAAINRIAETLEGPVKAPAPVGTRRLADWRVPIRFDAVGVVFGSHDALKDVSFTVRPGEAVAIVGRSGAGKSTLLSLLWRAREPSSGRILFADTPLSDIDPHDVRAHMAVVPQDMPILDRSMRENIALAAPGCPPERLEAAIRDAHLTDVVARLPEGLDTPLGQRGARLSGGERQRVVWAREFLKDPAIVLLDEATSALDPETESAVMGALARRIPKPTVFLIAHRLETVRALDRILVLDRGRLVGEGTHAELLQSCPTYRELRLLSTISEGETP